MESFTFDVPGPSEFEVWRHCRAESAVLGGLEGRLRDAFFFALTEFVNNVIDHSGARMCEVLVMRRGHRVGIIVRDDGAGVFEKIRAHLGLESERESVLALAEGRTTTAPDRHSGKGFFFAFRFASLLEISSGGHCWRVDNVSGESTITEIEPPMTGSRVTFELDPRALSDLSGLFEDFTRNADAYME